jgi:biotin transport system substrate-specific component
MEKTMALAYAGGSRRVLAELLPNALVRTGLVIVAGAGLTAMAAQLSFPIPGSPVPVTGQTFAVLISGAALGPARGVASQLLYLAIGSLGLPVFSGHSGGFHVLSGANGGYLVGFVLAAFVMGYGSRRGSDRSVSKEIGVAVTASIIIYACGAGWLAIKMGLTISTAFSIGVRPFLLGDALKAVLASALLPTAWMIVNRIVPPERQ